MQVPYGALIALSILSCVYLNDYFCNKLQKNTRCWFIILYTLPNIAGAFGLRFVPANRQIARLWCYYLTGPYNAAFVLILSLVTANTAGHTKKVVTNAFIFLGYCTGKSELATHSQDGIVFSGPDHLSPGNIAGPFFFKTEQAPQYPLGIDSMIFCHLAELAVVVVFRMMLSRENTRRDRKMLEQGEERPDVDQTAFQDMTDRENPNFRYVY